MENPIVVDVPLVTKFWDLDYGTYAALPNNCRISKVFNDGDGKFTVYCTKIKTKYQDAMRIEVLNPSFEFDYAVTTVEKDAKLNKPLLVNWIQYGRNTLETRRIFVNLFLYNKIEDLQTREKIREHVRTEYSKKETLPIYPYPQDMPENIFTNPFPGADRYGYAKSNVNQHPQIPHHPRKDVANVKTKLTMLEEDVFIVERDESNIDKPVVAQPPRKEEVKKPATFSKLNFGSNVNSNGQRPLYPKVAQNGRTKTTMLDEDIEIVESGESEDDQPPSNQTLSPAISNYDLERNVFRQKYAKISAQLKPTARADNSAISNFQKFPSNVNSYGQRPFFPKVVQNGRTKTTILDEDISIFESDESENDETHSNPIPEFLSKTVQKKGNGTPTYPDFESKRNAFGQKLIARLTETGKEPINFVENGKTKMLDEGISIVENVESPSDAAPRNLILYKFNQNGKIVQSNDCEESSNSTIQNVQKLDSVNSRKSEEIPTITLDDSEDDLHLPQQVPMQYSTRYYDQVEENFKECIKEFTGFTIGSDQPSHQSAKKTNNTSNDSLLKVNENGQMPFFETSENKNESIENATNETETAEDSEDFVL